PPHTTALPETIGGSSNWDYRFSWPRDASIGLSAFLSLGKPEEARSFIAWLLHASRLTRPRLHVLYTLDGNPGPAEREVPEAAGYRGSRPVRVGNAASHQHQLDVYGWVLDAAWGMVRSDLRLNAETWRGMSGLADFVPEGWGGGGGGQWGGGGGGPGGGGWREPPALAGTASSDGKGNATRWQPTCVRGASMHTAAATYVRTARTTSTPHSCSCPPPVWRGGGRAD